MTREEAIKFLKLMRKAVSNFEEYGHDKASMVIECDKAEAIDMAIEALSEPNRKPDYSYEAEMVKRLKAYKQSGDLISRADAIETIMSEPMNEPKYPIWFADKLKALPSADAEHGVWEHIESPLEDNFFKCSKCGNPLKIPTVDGEPIYNYCLHCGAKMDNVWGERND